MKIKSHKTYKPETVKRKLNELLDSFVQEVI